MGKTIQAISLIVTHRSDDMARPVRSNAAPAQRQQQQAAQRPKLRLGGAAAPKPSPPQQPQQQLGHEHDGSCCSLRPEAEALAGAALQDAISAKLTGSHTRPRCQGQCA